MLERLGGLRGRPDGTAACTCDATVDAGTLRLDAADCPGDGRLADAPACRATAVRALRRADADRVVVRRPGVDSRYDAATAALLLAAGRFAERAAVHDDRLADRAATDPLSAASAAAGRAGPVARIAAETALADVADAHPGYDGVRTFDGPTLAHARLDPDPPADARLRDTRDTAGATVRVYDADPLPVYHVTPREAAFDADDYATLDAAAARLADGALGGARAATTAVRRVAGRDDPTADLAAVLRKHTRGFGVLDDLFADSRVTDVYATAPADDTPLRVVVDGETMTTNAVLSAAGADALASRLRATSGRPLSAASPTLDAAATGVGTRDRVRAAAVTDPVSDGPAFAVRAADSDPWRLADLVANGTVTPAAAGFLSLAVERGAACLLAGPRGAGKTTLLGALCWELPPSTRLVAIEDTPELPLAALRDADRDAQGLRADPGGAFTPADAVRTALRLGDGALAVGEIRGQEAPALFEAMRVGAHDGAVLGTVHGEGAAELRGRVADLGVTPAAFAATDLVVTLAPTPDGRRVTTIEEVAGPDAAELYTRGPTGLAATGRIDRGQSAAVAALAAPDETYADVRAAIDARADRFREET